MADSPRLEELRRRVQADPASIAFAALAEEYRRAGKFREAVEASRAGLRYHPTYVSARVTLGRSLVELQEVEQAERELAFVLKSAPDNLAARRALGELCWQQLRFGDALDHFRTAHTLAPADTELPTILQSLERELAADRNGANGKAAATESGSDAASDAGSDAGSDAPVPALAADDGPRPAVATPAPPEPAPEPAPVAAADADAAARLDADAREDADARQDTVIIASPFAATRVETTWHIETTSQVDSVPQVQATPHVDAMSQVEATRRIDAVSQVEETPHGEGVPHVDATPMVADGTEFVEVEAVEQAAEFEPIDAVAFVDDHHEHAAFVEASPEAALPVVIEDLPGAVEVEVEVVDVVDVIDAADAVEAVEAPQPVVAQWNGRAHAPAPNPALVRLERFHRAILAARRRSQQQPRQHS